MRDPHENVTIRPVAVLGAGGRMGRAVAAEHPDDDLAVLFRGTTAG